MKALSPQILVKHDRVTQEIHPRTINPVINKDDGQ